MAESKFLHIAGSNSDDEDAEIKKLKEETAKLTQAIARQIASNKTKPKDYAILAEALKSVIATMDILAKLI